jgi:hypothetical protein
MGRRIVSNHFSQGIPQNEKKTKILSTFEAKIIFQLILWKYKYENMVLPIN